MESQLYLCNKYWFLHTVEINVIDDFSVYTCKYIVKCNTQIDFACGCAKIDQKDNVYFSVYSVEHN